jgi:hypothetical protein
VVPWLLELAGVQTLQPFEMPAVVREGQRNETLYRLGRSMKARGLAEAELLTALINANCVLPSAAR